MTNKLSIFYSLKFNPFNPEAPTTAFLLPKKTEHFCWRLEEHLMHEGGFALITGEPGMGKSMSLRALSVRLAQRRDTHVAALTHTTANLSDFYRELGDLFGVTLTHNSRWSGFKQLRERWVAHMESTLLRPIVLIDEAQEMPMNVLNELRLLTSHQFDSKILLTVVLAGDLRLTGKLKHEGLIPLGSRIRARLHLEHASCEELSAALKHLLLEAGNPSLMTKELIHTLAEHAMGNYRALCIMSNELLCAAFKREKPQLDEQLFLEHFALPSSTQSKIRS
jgi:general secretion pathway protein A